MKQFTQQLIQMYFLLASIITGTFSMFMFMINTPSGDINLHVIGCILFFSFVGHLMAFLKTL